MKSTCLCKLNRFVLRNKTFLKICHFKTVTGVLNTVKNSARLYMFAWKYLNYIRNKIYGKSWIYLATGTEGLNSILYFYSWRVSLKWARLPILYFFFFLFFFNSKWLSSVYIYFLTVVWNPELEVEYPTRKNPIFCRSVKKIKLHTLSGWLFSSW